MSDSTIRSSLLQMILTGLGVTILVACSVSTSAPTLVSPTQVGQFPDSAITSTANIPSQKAAPSASPSPTRIPIADGLASDVFKLPLTIQHITDSSAVLYFELSEPANGLVVYSSDENNAVEQVVPFDASTTAHQIDLKGLSSGVIYRTGVVVEDSAGQYHRPGFLQADWGEVTFRTWSDRQPLRFGIIGDSGFGDPVTPQLADQMAASSLDFTLQTGDIVYNVFENADPFEAFALKYYKPFSPLLHQMPVYLVVGNHDVETAALWNGTPFYDHAFPAFSDPRFEPSAFDGHNEWFAFAYGDVQFIMLNTEGLNNTQERALQREWLAERLADTRFSTSIPVFHVAPYTGGAHVSDGLGIRADWQPLFEQAGVRLVLSGHDHNYQRLVVNGITYIVSGGGSATLYQKTRDLPESQVFARKSHFVVFEVYPDRIDLKSIALGGDVIDQTSIPLR